jgi:hypothetical protein
MLSMDSLSDCAVRQAARSSCYVVRRDERRRQQFQESREKGIKHGQNADISALLTGKNLRSILEKTPSGKSKNV